MRRAPCAWVILSLAIALAWPCYIVNYVSVPFPFVSLYLLDRLQHALLIAMPICCMETLPKDDFH